MARTILVTGGTGTVGRSVVEKIAARGDTPRVLSRRPRPETAAPNVEWATGDLVGGDGADGVAAALNGVDAVVHCAHDPKSTTNTVTTTRVITEAARQAGTPLLVHISIVGIEKVPFGYYRAKVESERIVEDSGVPFTLQRATQFHDLVYGMLRRLHVGGYGFAPSRSPLQPIAADEVAARLVELAGGDPVGRATDMGGPEVRDAADLLRALLAAEGRTAHVMKVPLPGKIARAVREGSQITPENAVGTVTFEQYLAAAH